MAKFSRCENYTLEKDGVQVVKDVLTEAELNHLRCEMWEWLNLKTRHCSKPVVKGATGTYVSLFELFPKHGMLFQHWDFGHNPLSWYLRQHSKVINEFKKIWKTDDLLTSFDGISVSLPCEVTKRGWHRGKEWFHTDQCYKRDSFECVQGFVNIFDVNYGDATLRVLRGSHKLHSEFQSKFKIADSSDWHMLNEEEKKFYIDRLGTGNDICVKAPAGSLVLWDSRTIHQGMEPLKARLNQNIRCVPYICMTPASLATQAQLKNRIKYFEARRTCNHWPHKIKPFAKVPRSFGQNIPSVDPDDLKVTPLIKKLVGYDYLTL